MSSDVFDVVVVGAGIVGSACAVECVSAGLRTAIIEACEIGGGATATGMGHVVVMDDSEPQLALTRYSRSLWDELAENLPQNAGFTSYGTIWIAADEIEMSEVCRKAAYCRERGIGASLLNPQELACLEPNLRPGLAGALLIPGDSVVYAPVVARYLIEQAQAKGAALFLGRRAVELNGRGARLSDGSFLHAGVVINAAGSWAPLLTAGLEVRKRKGHLVITDRYPGFLNHQLLELGYLKSAHSTQADSVTFNVQPRPTGQLLIGSSRQYDAEDTGVDYPILCRMLARAREYMPALADLSTTRVWTGFRAAALDMQPLMGPWPELENLYLATGHEGLGITTSLGTAKLLVDQLLRRTSPIPIEPYLPSRITKAKAHV